MADQKGTTTIRRVVSKIKSRGRIPEERDAHCYQLVVDGMRELSLFNLPQKSVVKLPVDSLKRIHFPDDYLMFLSLGVPYYGKLFTFTKDNMLVQSSDRTYATESLNSDYGEGEVPPGTFHYSYGKGGTNEVTFFINDRRRYIQILGLASDETEVTLHYVSTGITSNPEGVEIPLIAEEALIAYALWMEVAYDSSVPIAEKNNRERLYGQAISDLNMITSPTVDEIIDNHYKYLYQTIKRF